MGLLSALPAAEHYLGLTGKAVSADLHKGLTLAQVAKSRGKTVQGLEQAVLRAERSEIETDVKEKKLVRSQATKLERQLPKMVQGWVLRRPAGGPSHGAPPAGGPPAGGAPAGG